MTANELADEFENRESHWKLINYIHWAEQAETMLRQQQAEIEQLRDIIKRLTVDWIDDFKNYKYNSDVPEQNKMRDDVFAILKKASEK